MLSTENKRASEQETRTRRKEKRNRRLPKKKDGTRRERERERARARSDDTGAEKATFLKSHGVKHEAEVPHETGGPIGQL